MQLAALLAGAAVLLLAFELSCPAAWVLALAWLLSSAVVHLDVRVKELFSRQDSQALARAHLADNHQRLKQSLPQVRCGGGVTLTLNRWLFPEGHAVMSVMAIPADHTLEARPLLTVCRGVDPLGPLPEQRRRLDADARQGDHRDGAAAGGLQRI